LTDTAIHALLDAYFAGLNGEDWAGLEALMCEEAELEAPGARRRGARAVAQYFRDALAPYPEHLDQPGRRLITGTCATVEIHFVGRMANGAPMEFDAVDVFDVSRRDGRIARLTSWYDSHQVRRALLAGQARGEGERAERAALALAAGALSGAPARALGGRWYGQVPAALCLPASVIEIEGVLRAEQLPRELRGRALLLRGVEAADTALFAGAAAVATDGTLALTGAPLWGSGFALGELTPGDGLLVSSPDADGLAHAVLLS
jgi:ketosteroid isomerase-like protein